MADSASITTNILDGAVLTSSVNSGVSITSSVVPATIVTSNVVAGGVGPTGAAGIGLPVGGTTGQVLSKIDATNYNTQWVVPTAGSGTVTTVGVTTANGVSGSVTNPTTTPAISLSLGAITPTSVAASGAITGSNLSGTNTGDQTITLTSDITGTGSGSFATTIANNAVTNAKAAQMAANTFKGNNTAGLANASDLTVAQTKTLLAITESDVTNLVTDLSNKQPLDADLTTIAALTATTDTFLQAKASAWTTRTPTQITADLTAFVGDAGAGGTKGLVPAPITGDATKFLKGDGTWGAVAGGGSGITRTVAVISTPTTAGSTALTDYVFYVTGTTTLTLPTAIGNTNRYSVNNDGVATVTIATTSSQTINGSTTITMSPDTSLDLISNGTNWKVY